MDHLWLAHHRDFIIELFFKSNEFLHVGFVLTSMLVVMVPVQDENTYNVV